MPSNLVIKSLGRVELSSGDGIPDQVAPIGSVYTDTLTGDSYVNSTGRISGWEPILKKKYCFFYITNNTTSSVTATNSWIKIAIPGQLIGSNLFTYSSSETLISATGDGGFSNTITTGTQGFADNGWIVLNRNNTNKWFVGTTGASGGTGFGAYISNNNGASNLYSNTVSGSTASYFYKDITIPAYTANYNVSFSIRVGGEGTPATTLYDYVRVYSELTTQNFTTLVAGGLGDFNSNSPTVVATSSFSTRTTSFTTPISSVSQTRRFAFGWINDFSTNPSPAPSIDNISVTTTSPISITYTGSQSTFRVLMTGSYQSAAGAINNASILIAKNNGTSSNLSDFTLNLSTGNRKESFLIQNIFTMSSGDSISPFINNEGSNVSLIINDLKLSIWEV